MVNLNVSARSVQNKHTHYEAYSYLDSEQVRIVINGDIAREFCRREDVSSITNCVALIIRVEKEDIIPEQNLVKEVRNSYRSGLYLRVQNADQIRIKGSL